LVGITNKCPYSNICNYNYFIILCYFSEQCDSKTLPNIQDYDIHIMFTVYEPLLHIYYECYDIYNSYGLKCLFIWYLICILYMFLWCETPCGRSMKNETCRSSSGFYITVHRKCDAVAQCNKEIVPIWSKYDNVSFQIMKRMPNYFQQFYVCQGCKFNTGNNCYNFHFILST